MNRLDHLALILLVVAVWGMNFVFIRFGLNEVAPFRLCAARFFLVAFPAVLFLPKPKGFWRQIAAYGLVIFALQFGLLFTAMRVGMSPGMASLLMQIQVFFTIGLAFFWFREKPSLWKIFGALISFSGIVYVAYHTEGEITWLGLGLTLLASFAWGLGNVLSKNLKQIPPLHLVCWGSLLAFPPMMVVSLLIDGALQPADYSHTWTVWGSIAYIAYFSTHFGYGVWSYLLHQYPAATVAPFTLLVPIFGFLGSIVFLNESLPTWKIVASALVVGGLIISLSEGLWHRRQRHSPRLFDAR